MMSIKTMYVCTDCWNEALTWKGQCESCKAWNTLSQFTPEKKSSSKWISAEAKIPQKINEASSQDTQRIVTASPELNTVLWWGIVPGSIILLSGEPGIWKSTLSLQLSGWVTNEILYISGEETPSQISARAQRLGISGKNISLLWENNFENILATIQKNPNTNMVILDSISVLYSNEVSGTAGSISQLRYITEKIVEYGKKHTITFFIIGHVTKDGNLAGPKTLEHMVDSVLYFEGARFDNLRILRNLKNRFGSSNEIWLYSMGDDGLTDITNPWLEFISIDEDKQWSSISVTLEGTRPLIIETEALTTYTKFWYPKRSARGILSSKLDLIIAVLSKYTPVKLENYDVYCNIARGLTLSDPWIDLAIAGSIISSKLSKSLPKKSVVLWEISLTGKIKPVMFFEKRLQEAEKIGMEHIFIPAGTKIPTKNTKIPIIELGHIRDFVDMFS